VAVIHANATSRLAIEQESITEQQVETHRPIGI